MKSKNIFIVFFLIIHSLFVLVHGSSVELHQGDKVVFFGDSITRMGARSGGYVDIISQTIATEKPDMAIQIIGAGVSGNKTPDLLRRLDRDVLSHNPQVVVIYIGINDIWHWSKPHPVTKEPRKGTTAEDYNNHLRELVEKIKAANARVVLCTPTVIGENLGNENPNNQRLDQYSDIVRQVAKETGSDLIDLRQIFCEYLMENNTLNKARGILTGDSVHMNEAGNQLIASSILSEFGVMPEQLQKSQLGDLDIYLCIGQSNMAGRAAIPKDAQEALENVYLLDLEDKWTPAINPMNQYSTIRKDLKMQKLSPSYSFAQKMRDSNKRAIGLILNAKGGSKIESWEKGGTFFDEAIRRVKAAQAPGMTLRGIIWHQGESNYQDEEYLSKLVQLIIDFRAELNAPELPFIAGQINNIPLINDQLVLLPQQLPNTAYVSSEGLVTSDKWHFDTKSILELGNRYAKAMLKLQKQ